MARRPEPDEIYRIAEMFSDRALKRDDSLFTPGVPVWSLEALEDLYQKFLGRFSDQIPIIPRDLFFGIVAYTWRGERIRLISARKTTGKERRDYERST